MQNARNRETLLCLDECISSYSIDLVKGISCTVSFGFRNEDGTFHYSPQTPEVYEIGGPDYEELKPIIERDGFKPGILWTYIDRVRNQVNTERRITVNANTNT